MNSKTKRNVCGLFALMALSTLTLGCNPEEVAKAVPGVVSPFGTFGPSRCFLNKLATEGIGVAVYTIASMEFRADGTGTNTFELFFDSDCATSVMNGAVEITYTMSRAANGVILLQVDQLNDPSDPSSNVHMWIPAVLAADGFRIDVDHADGESGPYLTEPTTAELADFVANPAVQGVFLARH